MISVFLILIILALLCAVASFAKPSWPLLGVAVLLLCIAELLHYVPLK